MTADENKSAARLWWSVPAASFLVLVTLAALFGKPPEQRNKGTSYDASGQGFRAAYLLLEGLDYPVARSKRRGGGGKVRLVLSPQTTKEQTGLDGWVRGGGILVLADSDPDFARELGIDLRVTSADKDAGDETAAGPPGVTRLAGGATVVEWPKHSGQVWAEAGERPFVTVYPHGRGEIWLMNRPEFLSNRLLKEADNAILLCRLADAVLAKQPGTLDFDEFVHGMRDRPGVAELLFQPPAVWITVQGLVLVGLLLWHFVPRFGTLRVEPLRRRRSKEEFLDALASLYERRSAFAHAYAAVRGDLVRQMERSLGLPAGTDAELLLDEAVRRRQVRGDRLKPILLGEVLPARTSRVEFLRTLNDVATLRDEFFHGRHYR